MNIYVVDNSDVIHETSADFVLRSVAKEIHVVQYDNLLPIVKVNLFSNGKRYVLPDDASVNLRFGKADHTFVYKGVLGCNESRDAVYFNVDQQMTAIDGKANPVLELFHSTGHLSSSPIPKMILNYYMKFKFKLIKIRMISNKLLKLAENQMFWKALVSMMLKFLSTQIKIQI